jgi:cell shape-determining protein MreC
VNPGRWSGEVWRWLLGVVVLVVVSSVTWTWAVAGTKQTLERSVDVVSGRVDTLKEKVDGNEKTAAAMVAGVLKELDAREAKAKAEALAVERRLVELETLGRTNQQLLVAVEGLKTEIRYLAANVAEIKTDLKDEKRRNP